MWTVLSSSNSVLSYTEQWRIQGRGPGGRPLFLDQTEAWRPEKSFFETAPPFLKVWSATAEACALYASQLDSRLSNT